MLPLKTITNNRPTAILHKKENFAANVQKLVNEANEKDPSMVRWVCNGEAFFIDPKHPDLPTFLAKYFQRKSMSGFYFNSSLYNLVLRFPLFLCRFKICFVSTTGKINCNGFSLLPIGYLICLIFPFAAKSVRMAKGSEWKVSFSICFLFFLVCSLIFPQIVLFLSIFYAGLFLLINWLIDWLIDCQ